MDGPTTSRLVKLKISRKTNWKTNARFTHLSDSFRLTPWGHWRKGIRSCIKALIGMSCDICSCSQSTVALIWKRVHLWRWVFRLYNFNMICLYLRPVGHRTKWNTCPLDTPPNWTPARWAPPLGLAQVGCIETSVSKLLNSDNLHYLFLCIASSFELYSNSTFDLMLSVKTGERVLSYPCRVHWCSTYFVDAIMSREARSEKADVKRSRRLVSNHPFVGKSNVFFTHNYPWKCTKNKLKNNETQDMKSTKRNAACCNPTDFDSSAVRVFQDYGYK